MRNVLQAFDNCFFEEYIDEIVTSYYFESEAWG